MIYLKSDILTKFLENLSFMFWLAWKYLFPLLRFDTVFQYIMYYAIVLLIMGIINPFRTFQIIAFFLFITSKYKRQVENLSLKYIVIMGDS